MVCGTRGTTVVCVQPQEPVTGPVTQPPAARGPAPVSGGPQGGEGSLAAPAGAGETVAGAPLSVEDVPERDTRAPWLVIDRFSVFFDGLLCLGGVGVVVSLYDEATEIKRSAPDAVVDNFLRAYLVNRDNQRASLYQCESGGDFGEIASYRNDMVAREKQFSVGIRVTWSTFTVESSGTNRIVITDLIKTATDQSGRLSNSWRFDVVDQDGWRVCGAKPLS